MRLNQSINQSSQSLLQVPRVKTDFGRRAFSSAAPQIWNHIPAGAPSPSFSSVRSGVLLRTFTSVSADDVIDAIRRLSTATDKLPSA